MRVLRLLSVLLIGTLGGWTSAHAQTLAALQGDARAVGLGGATTALRDALGGHANPAAAATFQRRAVGLYVRQAYGLSALRTGAAYYVESRPWGALTAGASTFGFDDYRELHATLGYARGLALGTSRRFYVGGYARFYSTSIARYGNAQALTVALGGLVQVVSAVDLGFTATNIGGTGLAEGVSLPRTLALGVSYRPLDAAQVLVDVFKDIDFPVSVRAGIEAYPVDALALRVGVASQPIRFAAGAGVRLGRLRADVAAERHQELGWSPTVALSVWW
jgi:hypothetical protein